MNYNFLNLIIQIFYFFIASYGALCGKFGVLGGFGSIDLRLVRKLLRFVIKDSCPCDLKGN